MIALIVDGSSSILNIKGWLEISDNEKLQKGSTKEVFSTMQCVGDIAHLVKEQDIIRIESNVGVFWGGIIEVQLSKNMKNICDLTIGLGTDFLKNEISNDYTNANKNDMYNYLRKEYLKSYGINNQYLTPLQIVNEDYSLFDGYIKFSDIDLPYSQATRQLRKQGVRTKFIPTLTNIRLIPYKNKLSPISINLEDTLDYQITFASDTFNTLNAYTKTGDTNPVYYKTFRILTDGTISSNDTNLKKDLIIKPVKSQINVFDVKDTGIDEQEMINFLKDQSYENSALIKISKKWMYSSLLDLNIFDNLGCEVTLYLNEYDITLRSTIEEISINNGIITLVFGLANTRLFDRIGGK